MKKEEQLPFEPIVIEGQLTYKITITEDEYFVESLPDRAGEIAAILVALRVSEKYKTDMQIAKDNKLIKTKDKKHFNGRLDKLINSVQSLSAIANDMIMTVLTRSMKKD